MDHFPPVSIVLHSMQAGNVSATQAEALQALSDASALLTRTQALSNSISELFGRPLLNLLFLYRNHAIMPCTCGGYRIRGHPQLPTFFWKRKVFIWWEGAGGLFVSQQNKNEHIVAVDMQACAGPQRRPTCHRTPACKYIVVYTDNLRHER